MLSMRSLHSATVLHSNSYYTVVASIFLVSAASCKAICRVASVRTSDYSQPFWLKWHAPRVLIKCAHVLICISAGEDSWHLSGFIIIIIEIMSRHNLLIISISFRLGFTSVKIRYNGTVRGASTITILIYSILDISHVVYAHSTTVGYPTMFHGIISH